MAATAYFQPKFELSHLLKKTANIPGDTLQWGLVASGTLAARGTSEGYEFVSDLLANGGSALTEVSTSGTGYSRLAATSVSTSVSGLVVTLTAANAVWPAATFTALYAWLHDETASSGTDATRPLIAIFDLGGAQTVSASTFTLQVNAGGIVTWTAAQ